MLTNLLAMNHFEFMVLARGLHFLLLIGLGGFKIPIAGIPCEFKRLCVINLIHLNCFDKIIILINPWEAVMWDNPTLTWVCQWCVTLCWRLILLIKIIEPLSSIALQFEIDPLGFTFLLHSINCFIFITGLLCLWVAQNASIHDLILSKKMFNQ
jgi:hypothetical protein